MEGGCCEEEDMRQMEGRDRAERGKKERGRKEDGLCLISGPGEHLG